MAPDASAGGAPPILGRKTVSFREGPEGCAGRTLAVIMLGVDLFERINDTHGHMAGGIVPSDGRHVPDGAPAGMLYATTAHPPALLLQPAFTLLPGDGRRRGSARTDTALMSVARHAHAPR